MKKALIVLICNNNNIKIILMIKELLEAVLALINSHVTTTWNAKSNISSFCIALLVVAHANILQFAFNGGCPTVECNISQYNMDKSPPFLS